MTRRLQQRKIVYRSLTLAFLLLVTLTMSAQWAQQPQGGVPAYNAAPPPRGTKLPALLTKADLWGADAQYSYQTHAYELAAKITTPTSSTKRARPLPGSVPALLRANGSRSICRQPRRSTSTLGERPGKGRMPLPYPHRLSDTL